MIDSKLSEKDKQEIAEQAKHLLEEFSSKLKDIKTDEEHFKLGNGIREEGEGWKTDPVFKEIFLANAPLVEDEFIVAEKGKWK